VDQAAEYVRLTGLHGQFGKAIDFQGGAPGQMLLSQWLLEDFRVHLLPDPNRRDQRIAISALVALPGGKRFRLIGAHLDASREDGDRWLRVGRLQDLFANDLMPAIMAGDFNDRPASRVMVRMLSLWEDASASSPQPTIPAERPDARIDFVLLRPPGAWQAVRSEVLPESVASGHRAVLVETRAR
jgi:endonuclease/exonuclease/phosphatase family metal-dependent hydrolase